MTLGQIIELHKERLGDSFGIEYRLMSIDGGGVMRDVSLEGGCLFERGKIVPLDGDSYSLSDELDAHTIGRSGDLIVWEDVTDSLCEKYDITEDPAIERLYGTVNKHIAAADKPASTGL